VINQYAKRKLTSELEEQEEPNNEEDEETWQNGKDLVLASL